MRAETVITFHGLGEPPAGASVGERRVWLPAAWLEALAAAAPARGLAFTFDDGNASDLEVALPILRAHGLSATFFVLVGRIGMPGHLRAQDIVALRLAGMKIGSHGLHHRDWKLLGDAELQAETLASRQALEEVLGEPVTEASCPFGSYDRRVLRALRAAGYEHVFTSDGAPGRAGSRVIARFSVTTDQPLDEWLELAGHPSGARSGSVPSLKRLLKRLI